MKKSDYSFMYLVAFFITTPVFAQSPMITTTPMTTTSPTTTPNSMFASVPVVTAGPAIEISIAGIGLVGDVAITETVRQVIGHAVAGGVIDRFIVLRSEVEGGFSACAEAPVEQAVNFNTVVNQLHSIQPTLQTTAYSVTPIESCTTDSVFCTQDVFQCPNGLFVGRVPPSCNFAACP